MLVMRLKMEKLFEGKNKMMTVMEKMINQMDIDEEDINKE